MSDFFISRDEAGADVLACAAFVAERVSSGGDHAEAIAAVVPRYLERGEVDMAAELANSVDDPFVRDRLLIAVAAKCADLDDDEYAMQLADAVEDVGLQSQAREVIARRKAEKGDIETARRIADGMAHPDEILAAVAVRQSADGNDEAAAAALAEIDFPASAVHALLAMSAAKRESGDAVRATEFLERAAALAEEIEHDEERIRSLTEVGHRFAEAEHNSKAIETFDRARAFSEELGNVHRDSLLAGVAVGFMHAGSVDLADRTLDLVNDKTQISTALLGFAREYGRRGEMDDALEALDEAHDILRSQHEKETRDSKAKFSLFASIAMQYAGFEKSERAIEAAEAIDDAGQSQNALARIAVILTTQGNEELARQALNAIPDEAQKAFALIGMSDAAWKADAEKGIAILKEAAEASHSIERPSLRADALNEIASRARSAGDLELFGTAAGGALDAVAEMRSEAGQAKALSELAAIAGTDEEPARLIDKEKLRGITQRLR